MPITAVLDEFFVDFLRISDNSLEKESNTTVLSVIHRWAKTSGIVRFDDRRKEAFYV